MHIKSIVFAGVHFGEVLGLFIGRPAFCGLFRAGGHFMPGFRGAKPAAADIVERRGRCIGLGLDGAIAIEQGGGVRRRSPRMKGTRSLYNEQGCRRDGDTPGS